MEMDKRAVGMMDYNGDMRKGRGGGSMAYRSPVSKEAAPGDGVSFYDKVRLCVSNDIRVILYASSFLAGVMGTPFPSFPPCLTLPPVPRATQNVFPSAVTRADLAFEQSGWVPWGGRSLLSVLTTHCLQAPFPLQSHYPL